VQAVGIILAGGSGSRLHPVTAVTNKHLLPIGEMPMIFYSIKKLVAAGIRDILVVTGTEHMGDFLTLLGSGKTFGCSLSYRVQDEAGGIAQALALGERFANKQPMVVMLGDNIFEDSLATFITSCAGEPDAAHILLKEVSDAERFGVAVMNADHVTKIVEKPATPPSQFAVTGIYYYPPDVFDVIRTLKPSARGEYEITDVNNAYIAQGRLCAMMLNGYWSDAGTFPSLARANELVRQSPPKF
jgi:glucose-1-phosphate thymidylyltransferase